MPYEGVGDSISRQFEMLLERLNSATTKIEERLSQSTTTKMVTITCESYSATSVYYFDASGMVQKAEPNTTFSALNGIVFSIGSAPFCVSNGEAISSSLGIGNGGIGNALLSSFVFSETGGCYTYVGGQ